MSKKYILIGVVSGIGLTSGALMWYKHLINTLSTCSTRDALRRMKYHFKNDQTFRHTVYNTDHELYYYLERRS